MKIDPDPRTHMKLGVSHHLLHQGAEGPGASAAAHRETVRRCIALPGFEVVSWADADKCYGRLVRVVGLVVATYRSDKVFIMNFHQDYRRHFKVAVFADDLGKFPSDPEGYYEKRIVRVTGLVREYEGAPEMIVNDPGQIEILE